MFRIWATQRLRDYIIRGYALNEERFKKGNSMNYFRELIEKIREIRLEEKVFYQQIKDIYKTSIDYDPSDEMTILFFKEVQNKLLWAVSEKTAAELVYYRANASLPMMGLTSTSTVEKVRKQDILVGKNYLNEEELKALKLIVEQYLAYAEAQALAHRPMYMRDWKARLDVILKLNERNVLEGPGKISHELAKEKAESEYTRYKEIEKEQIHLESIKELDKDIKRLLMALDAQVGHENYLLFLTADHGGAHNWKFMQDNKLNGGKWLYKDIQKEAEAYVAKKLGARQKVIDDITSFRIYLNHQSIAEQNLKLDEVKQCLVEFFSTAPNIIWAVDYQKVRTSSMPERLINMATMGYHPRRSGDILLIAEPGYYEYGDWSSPIGTTHGSWNPYDAHIPLLFYGWHIKHGATSREVHINDIAPTVCQMLSIQQPNACSGEAILEIFED
jgi:hypothetical protein